MTDPCPSRVPPARIPPHSPHTRPSRPRPQPARAVDETALPFPGRQLQRAPSLPGASRQTASSLPGRQLPTAPSLPGRQLPKASSLSAGPGRGRRRRGTAALEGACVQLLDQGLVAGEGARQVVEEQEVVARGGAVDRGFALAAEFGDGGAAEAVGDRHAVEAEPAAQLAGRDPPGEGGGATARRPGRSRSRASPACRPRRCRRGRAPRRRSRSSRFREAEALRFEVGVFGRRAEAGEVLGGRRDARHPGGRRRRGSRCARPPPGSRRRPRSVSAITPPGRPTSRTGARSTLTPSALQVGGGRPPWRRA